MALADEVHDSVRVVRQHTPGSKTDSQTAAGHKADKVKEAFDAVTSRTLSKPELGVHCSNVLCPAAARAHVGIDSESTWMLIPLSVVATYVVS